MPECPQLKKDGMRDEGQTIEATNCAYQTKRAYIVLFDFLNLELCG